MFLIEVWHHVLSVTLKRRNRAVEYRNAGKLLPEAGGREAKAELDEGLAPWAHRSGDPEPQRWSDGPVGLEHTQSTSTERTRLVSRSRHCSAHAPYKIRGSGPRFELYCFLTLII